MRRVPNACCWNLVYLNFSDHLKYNGEHVNVLAAATKLSCKACVKRGSGNCLKYVFSTEVTDEISLNVSTSDRSNAS